MFIEYYNLWDNHGIKLNQKIDSYENILFSANRQNEVCDLLWIINAGNQLDKSPENLSETVMNEFRRIAKSLLNHNGFKKYKSPIDVISRAARHFSGDHVMPERFIHRQPKIEKMLKGAGCSKSASLKANSNSDMLNPVRKINAVSPTVPHNQCNDFDVYDIKI